MKKKRVLVLGILLGIMTPVLVACSNAQTYASQCAYVIQNGYFDARHTKKILHPGERANSNNVSIHYVYCNARNYIVNKRGGSDLQEPIQAKTAPDQANGDGTPVDVQLTAYFTINQNEDVMRKFLAFCEKYNCFSPHDTTGNDTNERSSSQGWRNMIDENFPNAIHRAVQHAMRTFPPNVWKDPSQWPKVADEIQNDFAAQMEIATQSTTPFFCGQGSTLTTCDLVKFSIESIDPTDPKIRDVYNQQVQQQYQTQLAQEQKKTNEALLQAAKAKYGPYADYFLGLQDTIEKCNGNANCNIVIGNTGNVSIPTGGK